MRNAWRAVDSLGVDSLWTWDHFYPLYGKADVSPREPLAELFANREGVFGAAVEQRLLKKMGLKEGDIVKIGDLNVSRLARQDGLNYTQAGTPYYASPEVWKDKPYDFKSDVWSMGCIIYEMTCL